MGVQKGKGVGDLPEVAAYEEWGQAVRITFYEIEEIRGSRRLTRPAVWGCEGKDQVVIMIVFEEVEEGAYIRMSFDDLAFYPVIVGLF